MDLFSPAKVNLFFRVLTRRSDGYHEIASLYQSISLGDKLTFREAEEDRLTCDDLSIPCDERNLVAKALKTYREKTGYAFKVSCHIEKKTPMQAGLGGGSSNAATTLFALNALSPHPVDERTLASWASEFSSDAPFFFSSGSAFCQGRGEKLTPVSSLFSQFFWIAKPAYGLSTPLVYQHCVPETFPDRDLTQVLMSALQGKIDLFNDLEYPAFSLLPTLKDLKESLLKLGFTQVSMTGSGTAFLCFGDVEKPELEGISFFPVYFINRKPGQWYAFPVV